MQFDISNLSKSTSKIPVCSTMALEILRYCQNTEMDRPGFLKLISSDPMITVQILKIANTSLFNYPQKISSLERALVILGFDLLRDIAISLSVMSIFKDHNYQEYSHEICHHSVLTALSLKVLAQNYDSDNKEILYLGGLLHDIGKILDALKQACKKERQPSVIILNTIKGKGVSFMENNVDFHGVPPNEIERNLAIDELNILQKKFEAML